MSTRREDDSRPKGNVTSQRTTARDVPIAKYKEVPIGTVAPRGLRGPSLLPGQGAPERIVPEEVELAVLRDAETLDGPNVARVAAKRQPKLASSPSPMPVSVEVPRARSVPPGLDELTSTPPSPSGRSIQSGTLMSVGSIDPRAPTERALPSPRPLSVSERVAYFGPEAVVDRSPPTLSPPTERQSRPAIDRGVLPPVAPRASSPGFESKPISSQRGPAGTGAPVPRPSPGPDSVSPPARNFSRAPRSYSPVSGAPQSPVRPSNADASRRGSHEPHSVPEVAAQFQIHSELDGLPHELQEDTFDLRKAHTQREPLAGRKPHPSSDWVTLHAPAPESASRSRPSRSSTSAVTVLLDRNRASAPPSADPLPVPRAMVPLSWLIAAAVGVAVVLLALWILRASTAQDTARVPDDRATASGPSLAPLLVPPGPPAPGSLQTAAPLASAAAAPRLTAPRPAVARPAATPSARGDAPFANGSPPSAPAASAGADASAKARQSIY
jgi:hypothetical protein